MDDPIDAPIERRPGDPGTAGSPSAPSRSLHEMADLLGGRVWLERRLFEALGHWADEAAAEKVAGAAALQFAEASRRHGWHAQVWFDRMPELSGFDVEASVVPSDPRLVELFDLLDDAEAATATVVRLDAYGRVLLPRMIVAYRGTLGRLGAAADASVARWSRLVLVDDLDGWEQAESVLQEAVRTEEQLDALAASRRRIDALLLARGRCPPERANGSPLRVDSRTALMFSTCGCR